MSSEEVSDAYLIQLTHFLEAKFPELREDKKHVKEEMPLRNKRSKGGFAFGKLCAFRVRACSFLTGFEAFSHRCFLNNGISSLTVGGM